MNMGASIGALVLLGLGIPTWIALFLGYRFRALRVLAGAVLLTAAVPPTYACVRFATHVPSSFDPVADNLGLVLELLAIAAIAGSLHLAAFLFLIDRWLEVRNGPPTPPKKPPDEGKPTGLPTGA